MGGDVNRVHPAVHVLIGGVSGASGTIVTSPLEFLKTRLQSTTGQRFLTTRRRCSSIDVSRSWKNYRIAYALRPSPTSILGGSGATVVQYFGHVYNVEGGFRAFYKGLRPALVGIIPSRAVYFLAYSQYKEWYGSVSNGDVLHLLSAVSAGITMSTITSPLWVIKTKMQLDTRVGKSSPIVHYVRNIWLKDGFRGFYRGLSASYAGSAETGIYFVLYERLKLHFAENSFTASPSLLGYLISSSAAKLVAVLSCYPHEVIRTRLRQDSSFGRREYKTFLQAFAKIWREEKFGGLYGGMTLHLLRSVPNTAITFLTYETIISFFNCK